MIDIAILLVLNSLYCIGFYLSSDYGMLLEPIRNLEHKLGYWFNPIAGCITCMASLHSWPYLVMFGLDWKFIPYVFSLAALNTILYNKHFND
jgi:hypothetical protein